MAQINAKGTGGEPSDAVFELVIAACMIGLHNRPKAKSLEVIMQIVGDAMEVAEEWHPILLNMVTEPGNSPDRPI